MLNATYRPPFVLMDADPPQPTWLTPLMLVGLIGGVVGVMTLQNKWKHRRRAA